jgi:hypothetical protein
LRPSAVSEVPSIGSTAMSHCGPRPAADVLAVEEHGALSFSPSPITITPSKSTVEEGAHRVDGGAVGQLLPAPDEGTERIAAASVARTSSSARLRSGCRGLMSAVRLTMLPAYGHPRRAWEFSAASREGIAFFHPAGRSGGGARSVRAPQTRLR